MVVPAQSFSMIGLPGLARYAALGLIVPLCAGSEAAAKDAQKALAPQAQAASAAPSPPPYKTLRYDEDYSYLADPSRRTDFWDPIKYIPLSPNGSAYLSLGGEWRERFERTGRGLVGNEENGVILHRLLLSADLHVGDGFRAFGQFGMHGATGRDGIGFPTDRSDPDLQQGFVDIAFAAPSDGRATVRVGRQEMLYGAGRLVAVREGPNIRRSFDGVRGMYRSDGFDLDVFATRPVRLGLDGFDDRSEQDEAFWGAYSVSRFSKLFNVDAYYFGYHRELAAYAQGLGEERRHSVGVRIWGVWSSFDYDAELIYQFGRFASADISAYGLSSNLGWTFENLPFSPRLGIKANVESGDKNLRDDRLNTFNPMYPNHAYFSEAAIGAPMNDMDFQPNVTLNLTERLSVMFGWDHFFRESKSDAVYRASLTPFTGSTRGGRYVGQLLTTHVRWKWDRHLEFNVDYTRFEPASWLRKTGAGDVDFVMTSIAYKF